ncbi:MAG: response regulator [Chloroflexi bacterium]|nr:response regulator [Chloroflexota bacterium]
MDNIKTVLVIDSDAESLAATGSVLESESIRVIRAASPADALGLMEGDLPDAIVLEVMLPEATEGLHFTWNLRQHQDTRLRDLPILLVSRIHQTVPFHLSHLDSDWEYAPGEFLPVQGFLDKPVGAEALLEQVRGVLGLGVK